METTVSGETLDQNINILVLPKLDYMINFKFVSTVPDASYVDMSYDYLYLKATVPANISCDDQIHVEIFNNLNNLTSNYSVIYPSTQYITDDDETTDEPNLAFTVKTQHLYHNTHITDIRDIKHTTYFMCDRSIYLAIKRLKGEYAQSMKDTYFSGIVSVTNIHVATLIRVHFKYRPVIPIAT